MRQSLFVLNTPLANHTFLLIILQPCPWSLSSRTTSYYGQLSGLFRSFLVDNFKKLTGNIFPHLGCNKFTRRFLNLPGEHLLIRGKVRENTKSLATSLNTWQTKDYYFNGKFYLKTLNPKKTWWRHLLYISNIFFNDKSSTCESLGAILT